MGYFSVKIKKNIEIIKKTSDNRDYANVNYTFKINV